MNTLIGSHIKINRYSLSHTQAARYGDGGHDRLGGGGLDLSSGSGTRADPVSGVGARVDWLGGASWMGFLL
jgi:hypothetical protein